MNDRINKLQLFLKNLNSSQYYARHILLKRQLILSTYDDNLHFYYYKFGSFFKEKIRQTNCRLFF
jgi:hypothetical protein